MSAIRRPICPTSQRRVPFGLRCQPHRVLFSTWNFWGIPFRFTQGKIIIHSSLKVVLSSLIVAPSYEIRERMPCTLPSRSERNISSGSVYHRLAETARIHYTELLIGRGCCPLWRAEALNGLAAVPAGTGVEPSGLYDLTANHVQLADPLLR